MEILIEFENAGEEVNLVVDYDVEPFEPMTRHSPGCPGGVIINEVRCNGYELCLIGSADREITEQIEDILSREAEDLEIDRADWMYHQYMEDFA